MCIPEWGPALPSLFHSFPDGRRGLGLLLLRAAVGVVVLIQAGSDLACRSGPAAAPRILGLLAAAAGISLLAGLLTPIAAALVGLIAFGMSGSILPAASPNLLESRLSIALLAVVAVAVALLGPGAFSLDARWFGLREVIIPPPRLPK